MEDSGLLGCHAMPICKLLLMLVPLKHLSLFSKQHGVASQNT
jgi:hypothetical protein